MSDRLLLFAQICAVLVIAHAAGNLADDFDAALAVLGLYGLVWTMLA